MTTKQLLLIELNELNFEFIEDYVARGELPHFARLLKRHGFSRTTSEDRYERLEPWIQWVTAHTGRSLEEHGVFRLGDIVQHQHSQIWEELEAKGLRVGAISPMNASCRVRQPAFFVPDPWTPTEVIAAPVLRRLYRAICQAVNDNATSRVTAGSAVALLLGLLRYARPANYGQYLRFIAQSRRKPWLKAMGLDLLLWDVFVREVRRGAPAFASLFVNAAAHIQHHYLFSAAPYQGPNRNPKWYIDSGLDPVLDVYRLYDRLLGQLTSALPAARVMVATGLHQDPFGYTKFYWRLKEHAAFLARIGVPFERVEPRMSRDFLLFCSSPGQAAQAQEVLLAARDASGEALFEVDNRGSDLFVMLTYPHDVTAETWFVVRDQRFDGLREAVAFVALKNGEHSGIGYFLDTALGNGAPAEEFPLKELPSRVHAALGLQRSLGLLE